VGSRREATRVVRFVQANFGGGKIGDGQLGTLDELEPLIDHVGNQGLHINVDFKSEKDIDTALKIVDKYR
jgi:hypothetical protein